MQATTDVRFIVWYLTPIQQKYRNKWHHSIVVNCTRLISNSIEHIAYVNLHMYSSFNHNEYYKCTVHSSMFPFICQSPFNFTHSFIHTHDNSTKITYFPFTRQLEKHADSLFIFSRSVSLRQMIAKHTISIIFSLFIIS